MVLTLLTVTVELNRVCKYNLFCCITKECSLFVPKVAHTERRLCQPYYTPQWLHKEHLKCFTICKKHLAFSGNTSVSFPITMERAKSLCEPFCMATYTLFIHKAAPRVFNKMRTLCALDNMVYSLTWIYIFSSRGMSCDTTVFHSVAPFFHSSRSWLV